MTRMTRWGMTTVLAAVLVVAVVGVATAQDKPRPLYDRLGGVYSIATVVDDFIERLLVNDTLNANPAINQARSRVPKAGLKFHVTALVCAATGGPCRYTGRAMKESHQHTEHHRGAVAGDGGRFPEDARQVQGAGQGTRGTDHHRRQHEDGHRGAGNESTVAEETPCLLR